MDHAMIVKSKRKFPNLAYLSTLLLLCFSFPTITAFPVSRQIRGPRQIKIYAVDADSSTAAESIEGRSDDDKDVVIAEGIRPPTQLARMSDRTIAATDSIEGKSDNDKDVVRTEAIQSSSKSSRMPDRKIDLMFCDGDICRDAIRQRVIGKHNQIVLQGPATGQVAYRWDQKTPSKSSKAERSDTTISSVLLLVRPNDQVLIKKAAEVVPKITHMGIKVLLVPELAAKLKYYYGVDDDRIALFEEDSGTRRRKEHYVDDSEDEWVQDMDLEPFPDLVCTLGGDGLLMHASMMFQGPVPPIMSIAGGSLGFLTPFAENEMEDAICIALGMEVEQNEELSNSETDEITVFPPNMEYPYDPPHLLDTTRATFGMADYVCITIRMRLDCRIVSPEGLVRSRFNVLNEVVIDRGSSPYLAALECFCDDVHLTTVQADGVIFATPTGSTAYSMAAGGSVVHPAVPSILVTPICPHVLSFRSMVFPDHVVLRCYVPDDARATASVAFDGKHRRELQRGDSVQIKMSNYPVPTINKGDHSSDWLESLKRSFNFNTRPRQRPL